VKKIQQTKFGWDGNCYQAGVASILELDLDDVPNLNTSKEVEGEEMDGIVNEWLFGSNLKLHWIRTFDEDQRKMLGPEVYHLICGPSPRSKMLSHIVVGQYGEIIWDPHPDNDGLNHGFWLLGLFMQINPSEIFKGKNA